MSLTFFTFVLEQSNMLYHFPGNGMETLRGDLSPYYRVETQMQPQTITDFLMYTQNQEV